MKRIKKLLLISFLLFQGISTAQEFKILSLDRDVPIEEVGGVHYKRPAQQEVFLNADARDYFLEKYFSENISEWDNMERDIFYKKLLTYDYEVLKNQYDFIKKDSYLSFLKDVPRIRRKEPRRMKYFPFGEE